MNCSGNSDRRINGNGLTALVVDDNPHMLRFAAAMTEVAELMSDDIIDGWLFKPFSLEQLRSMLLHIGLPGNTGDKPQMIA